MPKLITKYPDFSGIVTAEKNQAPKIAQLNAITELFDKHINIPDKVKYSPIGLTMNHHSGKFYYSILCDFEDKLVSISIDDIEDSEVFNWFGMISITMIIPGFKDGLKPEDLRTVEYEEYIP